MDPITHALFGITIAETVGIQNSYEVGLIASTIGGAIISDSDFILRPFGSTLIIRFHHGPTHSLFGGLFLSMLCTAAVVFLPAIFFDWWKPPFLPFFIFTYLGFLTHIILDLTIHCNGLQILWPFCKRWFRYPLFIGLNPLTSSARCSQRSLVTCSICQLHSLSRNRVFFIFLIGFFLQILFLPWRKWVALSTLILFGFYALYAFLQKRRATLILKKGFKNVKRIEVYPASFSTIQWLGIGYSQTGYNTATVHLKKNKIIASNFFPHDLAPEIDKTFQDKKVREALKNFIIPYGTLETKCSDYTLVHFRDLSYYFTPDVTLQLAKIQINKSGSVKDIEFRERW